MNPGNRIKTIRLQRNFTQKYIAQALGMTHANYGKFENGKIGMSRSRLDHIAALLEVEVMQILCPDETDKSEICSACTTS